MTTMGMSTSKSRINVEPSTKEPKASKVISGSAHGASMEPRGTPDGWAKGYGGPGNTKQGMRTEEYGKSGQMQKHPTPKFSIPRKMPEKL